MKIQPMPVAGRTATRFDLAYASLMTFSIVCIMVLEMLQPPVRLLQIVLITVFGRLPTGWECVRLLVQKAWPWLTLSDMFFHLLVVHLLMPDVTLQIHLQKVAGVVLLACRYIPMFVRFLTRRASGVWEAIVAHLDWTIDDEVWCLSVEVDGKVFSVTKDAVWLVPRVLMRCLKGLAHVEARGGIACCVVRVLWWLSSVCSWAAAFGAMRQAAHLIVWLLPLLHAPSCPALEMQQRSIPSAPTRDSRACFTFSGQPLACDELNLARRFNREVMPLMLSASYADVRRAMTDYGLYGSAWHVGHARPDPSKRRTSDAEDRGHNLLAQHATDNVKLGHRLLSCAEAKFLHANHVNCARPSSPGYTGVRGTSAAGLTCRQTSFAGRLG